MRRVLLALLCVGPASGAWSAVAADETSQEGVAERGGAADSRRWRFDWRKFQLRLSPGRDVAATCDLSELLRYTPITGLQPGIACEWHRHRRGDSVELGLDTAVNLSGQSADWLLGPRLRLPSLSLVEVGAQIYDQIDTSDGWRVGRAQSSLSFALQNRPEADSFGRRGVSVFATALIRDRLLVGGEYRLDDYRSLVTRDDVWILGQELEIPWRNPAIQAGRMGSAILRVEWSSARISADSVGSARRQPETSLMRDAPSGERVTFRSLNTLEIARPALGGSEQLSFTRFISDHSLRFEGGRLRGLKARARIAGGHQLPPQKEEALGGWGSIRGYGFKRFRGDLSLMGTVEYRRGRLAAFCDAGIVREPAGWSRLLSGVGTRLFLWRDWNVGLAWRTSGAGKGLFPSLRLQLTDGW